MQDNRTSGGWKKSESFYALFEVHIILEFESEVFAFIITWSSFSVRWTRTGALWQFFWTWNNSNEQPFELELLNSCSSFEVELLESYSSFEIELIQENSSSNLN